MNITWITNHDNMLISNQFKFMVEKYTAHTVRVLSFLPCRTPYIQDLYFQSLEYEEPEFIMPRKLSEMKDVVKKADVIISSHGNLAEFYNSDFKKIDGEYSRFGDFYLWLETSKKKTVSYLYGNNSLYHNREWFCSTYKAIGNKFFTYDPSVFSLCSELVDIQLFTPPMILEIFNRPLRDVSGLIKMSSYPERDINPEVKADIISEDYVNCGEKHRYCYGYYGSNFRPSYDFFEDLAIGIIPLSDNEEQTQKLSSLINLPENTILRPDNLNQYVFDYMNRFKLRNQIFNNKASVEKIIKWINE